MLKRTAGWVCRDTKRPAAFRRLCVETIVILKRPSTLFQPPLGGCVLKPAIGALLAGIFISRL